MSGGGTRDDLQGKRFEVDALVPGDPLIADLVSGLSSVRCEDPRVLPQLRSLVTQELMRSRQRTPQAPPPSTHAALPAPAPRIDVQTSRITNVFDDFLGWLSEFGNEGTTLYRATAAYNWLAHRRTALDPPPFYEILRVLTVLGHVEEREQRGWIRSSHPAAIMLPDSEGLAVVTGARNDDTIATFESPDDDLPDDVANALQGLTAYRVTQVDQSQTPRGPSTLLVRLGGTNVREQSAALGLQLRSARNQSSNSNLIPLSARLDDPSRWFSREEASSIDQFVECERPPFGRWRSGFNFDDHGPHFLRAHTRFGARYLWWDPARTGLVDVGWIFGLWAFHSIVLERRLITRDPLHDRLLVRSWISLPPEIEANLIACSGLLARTGRGQQDKYDYWVYENIDARLAEDVTSALQQDLLTREIQEYEWL